MKIASITAHEVLAAGGFPTLEVVVLLESGVEGRATVAYGSSVGSREATVLVDGDQRRWRGKGMLKAIQAVQTEIAPALNGHDATNQPAIDLVLRELDKSDTKIHLGGNSVLAVSLACARAASIAYNKPLYRHIIDTYNIENDLQRLPHPMMVAIEGGTHADNTTDFQEYCYLGVAKSTATESIRMILESYHELREILKGRRLSTNIGSEGAYAPSNIASNEAPLHYILHSIEAAGYEPGKDIALAIDPAANEYFHDGKYHLRLENRDYTGEQMVEYFRYWFENYPIVAAEDLLADDDWGNWTRMKRVADENNVTLIGDDLTVTSTKWLQKAIDKKAVSGILIKLNQIGTLSETIETCLLAKHHNLLTIPSHRGGGETNDTTMVDLAVAVGSEYIKVGPTRGERVCKYNRLMEIERELGLA